jgi:hypothetical protein
MVTEFNNALLGWWLQHKMVLEMLVYSPFNHLMRLLGQGSFIGTDDITVFFIIFTPP